MKLTPAQRLNRFWSYIDQQGPDDCWEWLGATTLAGYGKFWSGDKIVQATHIIWFITTGHIPRTDIGEMICHHCDNPRCCNPNHLFLGSAKDNMKDMLNKERLNLPDKIGKIKLTKEQCNRINKLYNNGGYSHMELAEMYNVNIKTIAKALNDSNYIGR